MCDLKIDTVEVRSSSLLVPTISFNHFTNSPLCRLVAFGSKPPLAAIRFLHVWQHLVANKRSPQRASVLLSVRRTENRSSVSRSPATPACTRFPSARGLRQSKCWLRRRLRPGCGFRHSGSRSRAFRTIASRRAPRLQSRLRFWWVLVSFSFPPARIGTFAPVPAFHCRVATVRHDANDFCHGQTELLNPPQI